MDVSTITALTPIVAAICTVLVAYFRYRRRRP